MSVEDHISSNARNDRVKARIATAVYIIAILLFVILFGFKKPYPPYEEEGIFVNFGVTETGFGAQEPIQQEEPVVQETFEQPVSESVEEVYEEVETQDIEETVAIPESPKEKPEKPQPKESEDPVADAQPEVSPVEKVKEEPKPVLNEEALFNPSSSSGTANNEGKSSDIGNQGDPSGTPQAPNYEGTSKGKGNSGFGWSLSGRSLKNRPTIDDKSQKEGKVVIKIRVDKDGKVINAEYTLKGSTTSDSDLVEKAKKAAYSAEFNADMNAEEIQQGTFTFIFKLKLK